MNEGNVAAPLSPRLSSSTTSLYVRLFTARVSGKICGQAERGHKDAYVWRLWQPGGTLGASKGSGPAVKALFQQAYGCGTLVSKEGWRLLHGPWKQMKIAGLSQKTRQVLCHKEYARRISSVDRAARHVAETKSYGRVECPYHVDAFFVGMRDRGNCAAWLTWKLPEPRASVRIFAVCVPPQVARAEDGSGAAEAVLTGNNVESGALSRGMLLARRFCFRGHDHRYITWWCRLSAQHFPPCWCCCT